MSVNGHTNGGHCNDITAGTAQLKIIIVGAGLSGLGAGIQSALSGHSVLILESAKELGEVYPHLVTTTGSYISKNLFVASHIV